MKADFTDSVCALLGDTRLEVRCAAALVLGHAGRGQPQAVKALLAHAGDRDPVLQRHVLEALEALAPLPAAARRGLLERVGPLAASGDAELRARALRLVATHAEGKEAEQVLAAQLGDEDAPAAARKAAAVLLVKSGSAAADAALFGVIGDPVIGEQVLDLLRGELDADERARARIAGRADKALAKLGKDAPVAQHGALLRLVGYLGDEATLPLLAGVARGKGPPELRAAAIAAMRRALAKAHDHPKVVEALFALADDAHTAVAHAAVDTLQVAKIPAASSRRLAGLLEAKNPDARRLAAARLGQAGAKDGLPALVAAVVSGDPAVAAAATRSLARTDGAGAALAQALCELPPADEAAARRVAAALPRDSAPPDKAAEALARRGEKALSAGADDKAGRVVLEVLARAAPARYLALVLGRARKLRKAGDHGAAWALLRPVLAAGGSGLPAEDRFFAAGVGLRIEGKSLLRAARTIDPVLVTLRALAREGFPVAKALAKEKDLPADDVFVVGFNLVESTDENDASLGEELLEQIIAASPRSKLAVAARNKLRLTRGAD